MCKLSLPRICLTPLGDDQLDLPDMEVLAQAEGGLITDPCQTVACFSACAQL